MFDVFYAGINSFFGVNQILTTSFGVFFGIVLVSEGSDFVRQLPALWQKAVAFTREHAPTVVTFIRENPYMQRLAEGLRGSTGVFLQGAQAIGEQTLSAGAGLLSRVGRLLGWVVLPVYFAFFLIGEPWKIRDAGRYLPFLKADTRNDVVYLAEQFVEILVAFFRGQLIIAFLQGLLFGLGFWMIGLKYGFVLGLLFGFLNIIPYLGSILTLVTTIPLALLQPGGGPTTALLVLAVFTVVQLIEGYLLTPRIMGDRTGLHPMAIIVAIFFWGSALDGLTGMILAIPLTAFLVVFWRLAKEKWVAELV